MPAKHKSLSDAVYLLAFDRLKVLPCIYISNLEPDVISYPVDAAGRGKVEDPSILKNTPVISACLKPDYRVENLANAELLKLREAVLPQLVKGRAAL